jgi:hypothetical protein
MGKLVIGPEGFVDLRRNPPATTVTVQGFTPEPEVPRKLPVEVIPEPPAAPKEEVLPGRQKTTEGLEVSVAESVKVIKRRQPPKLVRIQSAGGPLCYAVVSTGQFNRLSRWHWFGTRSGHMYRKIKSGNGTETVIWFHREAANCNRSDKFVGFLDGDERNCCRSNLKVCDSKEEVKAIRRQALGKAAHG